MKIFSIYAVFAILFFTVVTKAADYGIFMVVKGDIKIQKLDNQSQVAKVGLKVAVGDTIVSAIDSRAKIVMSDRNVINISPSTKLKIEKYTSGTDKNVELSLSEGKVRTNVEQEYDGEKTKFLIKTPTAVAGVRGTQFITSYDVKTKVTEIVTLKGQVAFTSLTAKNAGAANTVLVQKGESSSMADGQVPEKPKAVSKDDLKSMDRDSSGGKEAKDKPNDKSSVDSPPPPPPPQPKPPGGGNCPPMCGPPPPPPVINKPPKIIVTPVKGG
ncbi:MAG: FecR family protein [Pseudobdellovibrio sp.]